MSETIKLIIEIPKEVFEARKVGEISPWVTTPILDSVQNGIPLDNDSEKAEVQAYFDGQAYGWEQGRKALIDDVRAEIEKKYREAEFMNEFSGGYNHAINEVLEVLKSIGKGDKE